MYGTTSNKKKGRERCTNRPPPTHTRTHARTHAHTHTHARTHALTHTHRHTRTHTHTHTHTHTQSDKTDLRWSWVSLFFFRKLFKISFFPTSPPTAYLNFNVKFPPGFPPTNLKFLLKHCDSEISSCRAKVCTVRKAALLKQSLQCWPLFGVPEISETAAIA